MNEKIFSRVPLIVIDTATNRYTRYVGARRTGQWIGSEPLLSAEIEALRLSPVAFFGANDPRGAA